MSFSFIGLDGRYGFRRTGHQDIYNLAERTLAALGSDSIIVKAVNAQNAKEIYLASIQAMDEKRKGTTGITPFMEFRMASNLGKYLQSLEDSQRGFTEFLSWTTWEPMSARPTKPKITGKEMKPNSKKSF